MEVVVIDRKGRIVIPSRIRKRLGLRDGDRLLVLSIKDDIVVLKKLDIEKLLRDITREISSSRLNLDEIAKEVEEEANKIAEEKIHARH